MLARHKSAKAGLSGRRAENDTDRAQAHDRRIPPREIRISWSDGEGARLQRRRSNCRATMKGVYRAARFSHLQLILTVRGFTEKFPVILFYKHLAWSLHGHEAVYDAVVEEHGCSAKSAKLDPACKSGVQSFYLPCTNRAHQVWAFFETYGLKTRDLQRCAIDPVAYGKTALSAPIVPQLRANSILVPPASREQIDAATETLRSMKESAADAIGDMDETGQPMNCAAHFA